MDKRDVCSSKTQHKTESSAQYVVSNENQEAQSDYYKCDVCGFFHVFTISVKKIKKKVLVKTVPRKMK